jgi:hypothetical protein
VSNKKTPERIRYFRAGCRTGKTQATYRMATGRELFPTRWQRWVYWWWDLFAILRRR